MGQGLLCDRGQPVGAKFSKGTADGCRDWIDRQIRSSDTAVHPAKL